MYMDIEHIEKLMDLMLDKGFSKLGIKEKDGTEISLETPHGVQPHHVVMPHAQLPQASEAVHQTPQSSPSGKSIDSPMVGTFYASPSPEDPPFVKVGDTVTPDSVVCIIEAMKVMNEVKAGVSGTVREVLAENASPVEFGTKLFIVE